MYSRIKTGLIFCLLATGCSDYQTGYQEGYGHGYQEAKHNRWIVFGRGDYLRGYDAGQAEKFQEEWVSEDALELGDVPLRCRDIKIEADALMFLPVEYRRISADTYQLN
jgi:hypothetical protein